MEDHLKQALEIVRAQASVRNMNEEEINSMILTVAKSIQSAMSETEVLKEEREPAVDPKKSIRERSIICLECGKQFKVITRKHLAKHELSPEEYRGKWGLKKNTSLVCKSLARDRRKKMQEMELWKKRTPKQKKS